jgi:hypothetical protein
MDLVCGKRTVLMFDMIVGCCDNPLSSATMFALEVKSRTRQYLAEVVPAPPETPHRAPHVCCANTVDIELRRPRNYKCLFANTITYVGSGAHFEPGIHYSLATDLEFVDAMPLTSRHFWSLLRQ